MNSVSKTLSIIASSVAGLATLILDFGVVLLLIFAGNLASMIPGSSSLAGLGIFIAVLMIIVVLLPWAPVVLGLIGGIKRKAGLVLTSAIGYSVVVVFLFRGGNSVNLLLVAYLAAAVLSWISWFQLKQGK
jgi:hypothetical protein